MEGREVKLDREKVIEGLEIQLDDLQKYADADEMLTLTQEQAKEILILLKEKTEIVRCKDCAYAIFKEGMVQPGHIVCTKPFTERWQSVKPDNWFCADGKRK